MRHEDSIERCIGRHLVGNFLGLYSLHPHSPEEYVEVNFWLIRIYQFSSSGFEQKSNATLKEQILLQACVSPFLLAGEMKYTG
jgi:hypothetical protein